MLCYVMYERWSFTKVSTIKLYLGKFLRFGSKWLLQCAKKVVSDSPGLVDFAIGLVISVINLSDEQVNFFEEFK